LGDFKEKKECWKLKMEVLDGIGWRICFGRGYGPVIIQTTK